MLAPEGAKFLPGNVTITPACEAAFQRTGEKKLPFLLRHLNGDYGNVTPERRQENDFGIAHNFRVISEYRLRDGTRFVIRTDEGRTLTEFLLAEEHGGGVIP